MGLAPSIARGLIVVVRIIANDARGRYLYRASRYVTLPDIVDLELRPSKWAYIELIFVVAAGGFFSVVALRAHNALEFVLFGVFALGCVGVGLWRLTDLPGVRLRLSSEEIVYIDGEKRREVSLSQVKDVGLHRLSFAIYLKNDDRPKNWLIAKSKVVSIPTSFESSEVVLALLVRAMKENKCVRS